jgi:hypothetical protein
MFGQISFDSLAQIFVNTRPLISTISMCGKDIFVGVISTMMAQWCAQPRSIHETWAEKPLGAGPLG